VAHSFVDIVPKRTWKQEYDFWKVEFVFLLQYTAIALPSPNRRNWLLVLGKIEGFWVARNLRAKDIHYEA
jgi:hypothetical protein